MKTRWLILILLTVSYLLRAQTPRAVLAVGGSDELPLRNYLYHLADTTGSLTIEQAIQREADGQFQPSVSPTFRQDFGYTTVCHWLSFALRADQPTDLMLEIEYANLDFLELYEVRNGTVRRLGRTGDRLASGQRPYPNNNYVFPLRLRAEPSGRPVRYFLRLDQRNAILSFFIRLWPRAAFGQTDRAEYLIWGGYIGIICLILVVNVVMLLATRDRIYLWYSLSLHFITMQLFSDAGLGFQYLWPDTPALNDYSPVYLYVWAAMASQLTFMQFFIHQTRHNSRFFWWVNAFKGVLVGAILLAIAIPYFNWPGHETYLYQAVALATSYFVPVMALLAIGSLYERRHEKEKLVRYYSYALVVQLSGYMVAALLNFSQAQGWHLPFDVETYAVIGLTVLFDTMFYSYGLAYRYNAFNAHNRTLELSLLRAKEEEQRRLIDSLEDERHRLAQDLHDDVGPTLATAKGYLSVLNRHKSSEPLLNAQRLLDQATDELRTISHQLMPRQFDRIGLANAIDESIRQGATDRIQFDFVVAGEEKRLPAQTEMLIFGIATELIRRVRRRARATEATVQLIYHDDLLNLIVEDNGPVSVPDRADEHLQNLRIKADFLKADLLIDVNEGGLSVILSVPILQPALA